MGAFVGDRVWYDVDREGRKLQLFGAIAADTTCSEGFLSAVFHSRSALLTYMKMDVC